MPRHDSTTEVSEWPLVSREECWRAYRPAQPFSESAFQRLRREAVVSPGVRLAARTSRRLSGQTRCFSRLNLLALEAYRTGDKTEARGCPAWRLIWRSVMMSAISWPCLHNPGHQSRASVGDSRNQPTT